MLHLLLQTGNELISEQCKSKVLEFGNECGGETEIRYNQSCVEHKKHKRINMRALLVEKYRDSVGPT